MKFIIEWWDVFLFVALALVHILGWISAKNDLNAEPMNCLDQRQFSANTLNNACVAGITAVSILIPATMITLQLAYQQDLPVPPSLFRSSIWFLASLTFGIFVLFVIPMRSQKFNVARLLITGLPFGFQLFCLLIGLTWFVLAIHDTIRP